MLLFPKILILGATGMLGSKLLQYFSGKYNVIGTTRSTDQPSHAFFSNLPKLKTNVDVNSIDTIENVILDEQPDVVINCIGIIKQKKEAQNPIASIEVNALFPHKLANLCKEKAVRVIHISTDCVFSGKKGNYKECEMPDPVDLYGRTKLVGELTHYENALTLRTSIVGRELNHHYSLFNWFINQNGKSVKGFKKAIYSGLTTDEMAKVLDAVIVKHTGLNGLYHLSSDPISKHELLCLLRDIYNLNIAIEENNDFVCDRSLNSDLFKSKTNIIINPWQNMINHMRHNELESKTLSFT